MKRNIIVDCHNDTMLKMINEDTFLPILHLGENQDNHIDIGKLQRGGLNVPFFAAYTPGYFYNYKRDISRTISLINALYYTERMNKDKLKIVYSLEEIMETIKTEKIAAISTIEGAYSLVKNNAIELLNQYYDIGVRLMGLTWNYSNELGEGVYRRFDDLDKTSSSGGLTSLGEKVIREMNNLGIIIDVSHLDEGTFWDVINVSISPIIASHSGVHSLKEHDRNLKDKQLLAIKENGGVIGVVFYTGFLSDKEDVYIKDYVDHIDYIVDLIGIDYVALGSDFDGAKMPKDLKDASEIKKIIKELEKRGYSDEDIQKIKYQNIFRVFKDVEDLKEKNEDYKIQTKNNILMGKKVDNSNLLFKTNIKRDYIQDIDLEKTKIIVDGIAYSVNYNKKDSTIYIKLKDKLSEIFHIITFKIVGKHGLTKRESFIFYV